MNGFINVNKPTGISSGTVVNIIKKLSGGQKVGHMGTLDPGAAGVLPIGIGKATKLFDYMTYKHKAYRARFTYGITTDTLDSYGTITGYGSVPNIAEINSILNEFKGTIMQTPPQYSALRINGVHAYELARKNADFEMKKRPVEVYEFKLLRQINENTFEFDIECGGGTYIRSLASDTAERLGTVAYMSSLIRLSSGHFDITNSYSLEEIRESIADKILPMDSPLCDYKKYILPPQYHKDALNGIKVPMPVCENETYRVYMNEELLGLAESINGKMKLLCYLKT